MNMSTSIQQYFDELSSSSPTPGGGNVSAICGALASSLGTMVCNLTIGKKKYFDVEQEMISIRENLIRYKKLFLDLAENDNKAFEKVINAMKLPKTTDFEKEIRIKAIEEATLFAADIPARVMKAAYEILPHLRNVIEKGNVNSISDAGVAAVLISTASKGAYLNVLINCNSLTNKVIAEEIKKGNTILLEETLKECESLFELTKIKINTK